MELLRTGAMRESTRSPVTGELTAKTGKREAALPPKGVWDLVTARASDGFRGS